MNFLFFRFSILWEYRHNYLHRGNLTTIYNFIDKFSRLNDTSPTGYRRTPLWGSSIVKFNLKGEATRIHAVEWINLYSCWQEKIVGKKSKSSRAGLLSRDIRTSAGLPALAMRSQCKKEEQRVLYFICGYMASQWTDFFRTLQSGDSCILIFKRERN